MMQAQGKRRPRSAKRGVVAVTAWLAAAIFASCVALADGAPGAGSERMHISGFRVVGQDVAPESELLALISDGVGKDLTFQEIEGMADRITEYLRKKGYMLAKAYIPVQNAKDGVVQIAVSVGLYGDVSIDSTAVILRPGIAAKQLGKVKPGAPIVDRELEKAVWLLDDIPGVQAKAALSPGSAQGTSDVKFSLVPETSKVSGSISIDNGGAVATGEVQTSLSLAVKNLDGAGEITSLRAMTTGAGLLTGTASISFPVAAAGTRVGLTYSHLNYSLVGGGFDVLQAAGTAEVAGAVLDVTYKRNKTSSHSVQSGLEYKKLHDEALASTLSDRRLISAYASAIGQTVVPNQTTGYSLTAELGQLDILDKWSASLDAASAKTEGFYMKLSGSASVTRMLTNRFRMTFGASAQFASKNLDATEKLAAGGASAVRAYRQGESSGDMGLVARSDLIYTIAQTPEGFNVAELGVYLDGGYIMHNVNTWPSAGGPNTETLWGTGIDLGVATRDGFSFNVGYSVKLDPKPGTDAGRFQARVAKAF